MKYRGANSPLAFFLCCCAACLAAILAMGQWDERTDTITHLPAYDKHVHRANESEPSSLVVQKGLRALTRHRAGDGKRTVAKPVLEPSNAESGFILGLETLRPGRVAQGRRGPRLMTRRFSKDVGRLDSGHGLECHHPQHSIDRERSGALGQG
jgi:hypothetical protein